MFNSALHLEGVLESGGVV